jgi:hypothetical protein
MSKSSHNQPAPVNHTSIGRQLCSRDADLRDLMTAGAIEQRARAAGADRHGSREARLRDLMLADAIVLRRRARVGEDRTALPRSAERRSPSLEALAENQGTQQ